MCYLSLGLNCVGCVAARAARPAPAVTPSPTVGNSTRASTGNTLTRGSAAVPVQFSYWLCQDSEQEDAFFLICWCLSLNLETSTFTPSPLLFPEWELVTEPEEEEQEDAAAEEEEGRLQQSVDAPSLADSKMRFLQHFEVFGVILYTLSF